MPLSTTYKQWLIRTWLLSRFVSWVVLLEIRHKGPNFGSLLQHGIAIFAEHVLRPHCLKWIGECGMLPMRMVWLSCSPAANKIWNQIEMGNLWRGYSSFTGKGMGPFPSFFQSGNVHLANGYFVLVLDGICKDQELQNFAQERYEKTCTMNPIVESVLRRFFPFMFLVVFLATFSGLTGLDPVLIIPSIAAFPGQRKG